jgi:phosphoenolpyruvate-protein phosphotransferase/dihydroxyacetone kinase phosphotransfer subunit
LVALVLVSHSHALAAATRGLVLQMAGPDLKIGVAAGIGDNRLELGTDAIQVAEILGELRNPDGIVVLMDLGSAVLSAQAALELVEPGERTLIRLSAAPFVEGAVVAGVQAYAGSKLDEVIRELDRALAAKREQVGPVQSSVVLDGVAEPDGVEYSETVLRVTNEHGLHARPAAELVSLASKYSAEIEVTNMSFGAGPASARSITSIALLQVSKGDQIRIRAWGRDRENALAAITELAKNGFGEGGGQIATRPSQQRGVPASPGIVIGPLLYIEPFTRTSSAEPSQSPQDERRKLREAIARATVRLAGPVRGNTAADAIRSAQRAILDDPVLLQKSEALVASGQGSAFTAWTRVCDEVVDSFQAMKDSYLRERAADIRDVKQMVLQEIQGSGACRFAFPRQPCILFTHELLPSEAALCAGSHILGVIARQGSPTSHAAILLRSAGIPMVTGVDWITASDTARTAAMDGSSGDIWIDPPEDVLQGLRKRQQQREESEQHAMSSMAEPAITQDGVAIELMANVSSAADAELAARYCADGIGLLRTELLFSSTAAVSEADQICAIQQALGTVAGPLLVRTLDIGGDKPLPALPCEPEANPFLGVRGLRLTLRNASFFRQHLGAILQAGAGRDLWIMFPMVSTVKEIAQARDLISKVHAELAERGTRHAWPVKLGCMIEVPSAALLAETLARELHFFSIGTNDLTQYTLAAERGNAALSDLQDALHPAVLQLVDRVVRGARTMSRHVSICGEAAADPVGAAVFLGLGVRSLSVPPTLVPKTKAWVRSLRLSKLRPISEQALQCNDAGEVRSIYADFFASHNGHVSIAR